MTKMKAATIRRLFVEAYDGKNVFEPNEKFWKAVKQVAEDLGNKPKGKKMRAVLCPERKAAVLAEYDAGGVSHAELAAKYGIKKRTKGV
jgi:hypothetical protein